MEGVGDVDLPRPIDGHPHRGERAAGRRSRRRRSAAARPGENRERPTRRDLLHHVVVGIGDVDVPRPIDPHPPRREKRAARRRSRRRRSVAARPGENRERPTRRDLLHHVVVGIGDVDVPRPIDPHPPRREKRAARRRSRRRRSAAARPGENRERPTRRDLLHHVVVGIGDVDVPRPIDPHPPRREKRAARRRSRRRRSAAARPGDDRERPGRRDLLHDLVVGVGDVDVPRPIDRHPLREVKRAAGRRSRRRRSRAARPGENRERPGRRDLLHHLITGVSDIDVPRPIDRHPRSTERRRRRRSGLHRPSHSSNDRERLNRTNSRQSCPRHQPQHDATHHATHQTTQKCPAHRSHPPPGILPRARRPSVLHA